jgi:hypothetical protein
MTCIQSQPIASGTEKPRKKTPTPAMLRASVIRFGEAAQPALESSAHNETRMGSAFENP